MTNSMTAFARVQNQEGSAILCWEIKSVNHRYLDVSFRLPEAVRYLEAKLRAILTHEMSRGKLECQLKINGGVNFASTLQINTNLIQSILDAGEKLASRHQLANDLTVSRLLSYPDVLQSVQPDIESLSAQIEASFHEAIKQLQTARKVEGNRLKELIKTRLDQLNNEIQRAKMLTKNTSLQTKEKLLTRLQQLQVDVGELRIEQEIAVMLTRLDVSEELDRLATHSDEVANILDKEQAAGRRLDFLMQELNREANTLSSKSDNIELTQCAIEMKVLIEQMREQIQNIE